MRRFGDAAFSGWEPPNSANGLRDPYDGAPGFCATQSRDAPVQSRRLPEGLVRLRPHKLFIVAEIEGTPLEQAVANLPGVTSRYEHASQILNSAVDISTQQRVPFPTVIGRRLSPPTLIGTGQDNSSREAAIAFPAQGAG
jgi:hypothetical protein